MRLHFKHLLVVACFVPLLILVHEIGHLLAGMAIGVASPKLSMGRFVHGPAPWLQREQIALIAASGPAVTFTFAIAGLTISHRRHAFIASAVSAAACVRMLELLPYALSAVARRFRGSPPRATTFDEDVAFHALGLPGDIGLILTTLAFAVIVYVLLRLHARQALSLAGGGLLGWITWAAIIGA